MLPVAARCGGAPCLVCLLPRVQTVPLDVPMVTRGLSAHADPACRTRHPDLSAQLAHADDRAFAMLKRMLSVAPAAAPDALAAACRNDVWSNTPDVIAMLAESAHPGKGRELTAVYVAIFRRYIDEAKVSTADNAERDAGECPSRLPLHFMRILLTL